MAAVEAGEYDVIVLGGGPAGENAASYAIAGSTRTAVIVERELVGGECSYWACMPSKALLRPVEVRAAALAMPGVPVGELDVAAVLRRRDSFTSHHDDSGQVRWAESEGIDVVRGHARLAGDRLVRVTGADGAVRELRARHAVVLASGSTAAIPPGLAAARPWTSRDVTNLHDLPARVLIVGGGVVACESATWLAALGAKVTLAVRGPRLLSNPEPFAGEAVANNLAADIRFNTVPSEVSRPDARDTGEGRIHGGPVEVVLGGETLAFDEIVVAAGRRPATADLGLESVGLEPGRAVAVDDHLTAVGVAAETPWLYAVGDVNGRSALTHMGKYQARVCGDVIAARAEGKSLAGPQFWASADNGQVPQVVFTSPQAGAVGLTVAQAGADAEVVAVDLGSVAGAALHADGYEGRAQLVIEDGVVVGASFVGPDVAELVHAATIAVVGRVPVDRLWHAVPSYPTVSEVWLRLLEARRG